MSVNSGYRNFILNPKATDATIGTGEEIVEENDAVMGNVMSVYNSGGGNFQLSCKFDDDNRSKLSGKTVTCYAVVKPMSMSSSGSAEISFGIWSPSYHDQAGLISLNSTAASVVNNVYTSESGGETGMTAVGNGWYVVWATFNAGSIFSEEKDNCGINSVNGSRWLVYGYGILVGETCPSLGAIMTNTGLRSAGINIENGVVNLYGGKVTFSDKDGGNTGKVYIDPENGTLHATDGTFSGSLDSASGTFTGSVISNNNNVLLTKTKNAFGLGYTWAGFAATSSGNMNGDLATIGARLNDNNYDYGRIALMKRNTGSSGSGTVDNNTSIFISAKDGSIEAASISLTKRGSIGTVDSNTSISMSAENGSIEAAAYKIKHWDSWESGDKTLYDSPENRRLQLLIYTGPDVNGRLYLKTKPERGTVLMVKRQRNSGWLTIYNAADKEIGDMPDGGVMMCVYDGNNWQ